MMIFRKISLFIAMAAVAASSLAGQEAVSHRSAAEDNFIAGLRIAHGEAGAVAVPDTLERIETRFFACRELTITYAVSTLRPITL